MAIIMTSQLSLVEKTKIPWEYSAMPGNTTA